MHSASDVAQWILTHNESKVSSEGAEYISALKLQKLLYYSQGCFLAIHDRPLFSESIEAWEHGPVVPEVWHEYKNFRSKGIENTLPPQEKYTPEEETVLFDVYNVFGQYSAWGLREMTHNETPWLSTKKNDVINPEVIKKYFKEHIVTND